jgi:hypothetical protein
MPEVQDAVLVANEPGAVDHVGPPEVAVTPAEIVVLDRIAGSTPSVSERTVAHYLLEVAKLGGYLARTKDPPPGNMVVWRGLTWLTDLCLGFELNNRVVGN